MTDYMKLINEIWWKVKLTQQVPHKELQLSGNFPKLSYS